MAAMYSDANVTVPITTRIHFVLKIAWWLKWTRPRLLRADSPARDLSETKVSFLNRLGVEGGAPHRPAQAPSGSRVSSVSGRPPYPFGEIGTGRPCIFFLIEDNQTRRFGTMACALASSSWTLPTH